jgi:biotin transport system substrate-specific component
VSTRILVRIALFAAIIAALGLLPKFDLPFGVPITAQTLGVMLAGVILGPRHGAAAVLLFVLVVALGAPLLAGGRGGLGVFFSPTAGYLIGFAPGAFVAGWIYGSLSRLPAGVAATLAAMVGGIGMIHGSGILGLSWITGMPLPQAALASLAFVPGDLIKAVAVGMIVAAMPASFRLNGAPARA